MVPCSAFFLPSQNVRKNVPSFLTAFLWPPGGGGDLLEKERLDGLDRIRHLTVDDIGEHWYTQLSASASLCLQSTSYSPPPPPSIMLEVPQISANGVTVYGVLFFFFF
jgi:hypothetical protein